MRPMEVIWYAIFRVWLRQLKPKRRFLLLQEITEAIGDPSVIPFMRADAAMKVVEARETWAKMLTKLAA